MALGGLFYWRAQAASTAPLTYTSAPVARGNLVSSATATGTVAAWNETVVHAQTSGFLEPFTWNPSNTVTAGETLFRLSDPALSAQLVQDRQNLQLAQVTQAQIDSQLAPNAGQQAAVDAAQQTLASALDTLGQDRRDVADLTIAAPVGGTIQSLDLQSGQAVAAGASVATIVWEPGVDIVEAAIPPSDVSRLRPGMPATVSDAAGGGSLPATLLVARPSGRLTLSLPAAGGGVSGRVKVALPSLGLTIAGMVDAGDQMTVAAQQGGTVSELPVAQGQVVRPGETLAVLTDPPARYALVQATQAVATARDQLTEAQANVQGDEQQAQDQLAQQQIKLDQARSTLAADTATAGQLVVTSPVSGVVSQVLATPGQWVTSGTPLLTIGDYRRLLVTFPLDESDIDRIHAGEPAQLTTDAVPGKTIAAKVYLVSPEGTNLNGVATFNVTLVVSRPSGLKPGMAVNVSIVTGRAKQALSVPIQALHVGPGGRNFVVVVHDGSFRKVPVQVGISDDADAVVTGHLTQGQQVVTSSLTQLQTTGPGLRVNGQYLRRRVAKPQPRIRKG